MVRPIHALNPEAQTLRCKFIRCLRAHERRYGIVRLVNLNQALLNQTSTDAPGTKTLRVKNVLQLHGGSIGIDFSKLILSWVGGGGADAPPPPCFAARSDLGGHW